MPSILIINPASDTPSYYTSEAYEVAGRGGWAQVADLTVATVAAFVPRDWHIEVVDEAIERVDPAAVADFVAITGKSTQRLRMQWLASMFRKKGAVVLIGGSFATLSPDDVRPHADILVRGEIEEIAPKLFADLEQGTWLTDYDGGRADITLAPPPRWDLYPVGRAQVGAIQTTRGCPFSCEFCDVIQYQGRKQRHKTVDQVRRELDGLHAAGFRTVLIVDDNFTAHRRWAREVLQMLTEWNQEHAEDAIGFTTQTSLDVARDPELLALCRAAGLRMFFVGVETMNEASLRETRKKQNLLMPLTDAIGRILEAGIVVQAGIIAGFDHDTIDIFDELYEFLQASALPFVSLGALTAPQATDLYRRLEREGRLTGPAWEAGAATFDTNILPKQMTRAELASGVRRLVIALYAPEAFEQRMMTMIAAYGIAEPPFTTASEPLRERARLFLRATGMIGQRGKAERMMVMRILEATVAKPAVTPSVAYFLILYEQVRYLMDGFEGKARMAAHATAVQPSALPADPVVMA